MLAKCVRLAVRLGKDRCGASAVEYALVAGVIGLGIIVGLGAISGGLNDIFSNVSTEFSK